MQHANTDEVTRHELLARDMFLSDRATELDAAEKKGKEEGIEIGVEKGIGIGVEKGIGIGVEKGIGIGVEKGERKKAIETAKRMLNKGFDAETVAELTDLSVDEIKKLATV